jgi:hypothetical protein
MRDLKTSNRECGTDGDNAHWLRRLVRLLRGHTNEKIVRRVFLVEQDILREMIAPKKCGEVDDVIPRDGTWFGIKLVKESGKLLAVGREVKLQGIADGIKGIGQKKASLLQYLKQPFIFVCELFHGRKNVKQPNR